jgi:hypothetical protein
MNVDAAIAKGQTADPVRRARQLRPLIEAAAAAIEQGRQVTAEVQAALHEAGLFRLYLPRTYGGEEVEPATFVAVIEEIAKADASTAWCVAQGSGCSLAAAYVDPAVAREIFGAPDAVLSWGPVGQNAKALVVDGGTGSAAAGPLRAAAATRAGSPGIARWSMTTASRGSGRTARRWSARFCSRSRVPLCTTSGMWSGFAAPAATAIPSATSSFPRPTALPANPPMTVASAGRSIVSPAISYSARVLPAWRSASRGRRSTRSLNSPPARCRCCRPNPCGERLGAGPCRAG